MPGAIDISSVPLAPKDGPDLLMRPLGIGVGFEWQRLGRWIRFPESQSLQDGNGGDLAIQGIQVNASSVARVEQVLDHGDGLMDAIVTDGVIVALQRLDHVLDLVGNFQLGQLHNVTEGVVALDGHDARDDGAINAYGPAVVVKLFKGGRFEKQLGDDEISSLVHLKHTDHFVETEEEVQCTILFNFNPAKRTRQRRRFNISTFFFKFKRSSS